MEEKHGKSVDEIGDDSNGSGSSSDEDEDDEGVLASTALDEQINDTLQAIRNKDPRVYDGKSTFYIASDEEDGTNGEAIVAKEKPMYLRDYHRENLLRGDPEAEEERVPPTYAEQQDELKNSIVREMHASSKSHKGWSANKEEEEEESGEDEDFLVKKQPAKNGHSKNKTVVTISVADVEIAERDPETFLSNFMSARAWVPSGESRFQPFESDDDEEDQRAEAFEEAYNLRFEDPKGANEKLISHARDTAVKYSVRKEPVNSRKRIREAEQAKKDDFKAEREQEKSRLRKLKIEDAEEKVQKIKAAAGIRGKSVQVQEWSEFLTEDWDDDRWEKEMKKKFGDDYYEADDANGSDVEGKSRKIRKPKWNDDVDITDIVPEFAMEENEKVHFSLSDDDGDEDTRNPRIVRSSKKRKLEKEDQKREARRERRRIELLVDEKLNVDLALTRMGSKGSKASQFRYRETSPTAYGLTPSDILLASDTQLNQYAGLKKMAAFRDAEKKRKDKKMLSKKARLRQWRKETFGHEQGPQKTLQDVMREQQEGHGVAVPHDATLPPGIEKSEAIVGKKRKRTKKAAREHVTT